MRGVRIGLGSPRRMIGMRMINADDVPRTAVEFPLHTQLIERIHEVTIAGTFGVEVLAFPECVNGVILMLVRSADQQTAAFVRVRRFGVIVDLSQ